MTKVPIGTVMSRLARARRRLIASIATDEASGRDMSAAMENDPALLVHAYLDGELDPVHALEVERQLAADPALAAERDRIEALRRVIEERLPRVTVPPGSLAASRPPSPDASSHARHARSSRSDLPGARSRPR